MANALAELVALGLVNGWTLTSEPNAYTTTWERPNPDDKRKTEFIDAVFDINGRCTAASWSPSKGGTGGRRADRQRRAFIAEKFTRTAVAR